MNKKGFTLIELLVAITIVGTLSGFAVVQMNGSIDVAQDSKKKVTVDSIKKALVMYSVENGETYPIETGCTIGVDCTNLDAALSDLLPDTIDGTYTYQSNGTGCTISTILSTGLAYQYDCLTGAYSTNEPVAGSCGTSNGANLSSIPVDHLCITGDISAITGSGPWSWTCIGINGGANASCATGSVPVDGVCGVAHSSYYYSAPPSNELCSAGTASEVSGTGPWSWFCNGSYGLNPACAAGVIVDAVCGSSNGASLSSAPTTNLCLPGGTASEVTGTGPWSWTCAAVDPGIDASCSANLSGVFTCSVVTGTCSGVDVLHISGGHAELNTQTNYTNKLCCTGGGITVTNITNTSQCAAGQAAVLKLSDLTNAHVEKGTETNYTNKICLSSTGKTATCAYAATCDAGYTELTTISDGATNLHFGDASYATKVCCKLE
jgi:prepilin-type N-terminal cleavage/methylation domain-containing protein